jgi:CheY-like chemotaxis protein
MKRILVVEDAGPDRRRFRILLDNTVRSLQTYRAKARTDEQTSAPLEYFFAWDAKEKRVAYQMDGADKTGIREELNSYDYMFLDLAWTKDEEDVMNRAKRQSGAWLWENADHWTEQSRSEMGTIRLQGDGLVRNISGFALLDMLQKGEKPKTEIIVTTGFYSEAVAHFCMERWMTPTFYKWEDENKIADFLFRVLP